MTEAIIMLVSLCIRLYFIPYLNVEILTTYLLFLYMFKKINTNINIHEFQNLLFDSFYSEISFYYRQIVSLESKNNIFIIEI